MVWDGQRTDELAGDTDSDSDSESDSDPGDGNKGDEIIIALSGIIKFHRRRRRRRLSENKNK